MGNILWIFFGGGVVCCILIGNVSHLFINVREWDPVVPGRGRLTRGTWGPGPAVNPGRGQEERVTCADTQGRWPRPTLPPGAPVGEAADVDRVPVCRGTGCRCSGCSSCSLDGGCAPPDTHTPQDSAGGGGCPFSPLVISPSPTWTLPPGLPLQGHT